MAWPHRGTSLRKPRVGTLLLLMACGLGFVSLFNKAGRSAAQDEVRGTAETPQWII